MHAVHLHQVQSNMGDVDALLILMQIIHGRNGSVPRKTDLEKLARIPVLVDSFDCFEAVQAYMDMWFRVLMGSPVRLQ